MGKVLQYVTFAHTTQLTNEAHFVVECPLYNPIRDRVPINIWDCNLKDPQVSLSIRSSNRHDSNLTKATTLCHSGRGSISWFATTLMYFYSHEPFSFPELENEVHFHCPCRHVRSQNTWRFKDMATSSNLRPERWERALRTRTRTMHQGPPLAQWWLSTAPNLLPPSKYLLHFTPSLPPHDFRFLTVWCEVKPDIEYYTNYTYERDMNLN